MAIFKVCKNNLSIRVLMSMSVFLLLLVRGASSLRQGENAYAKYESDVDGQESSGPSPPDQAYMVNYIQELLRRPLAKRSQSYPVYNIREDASDGLGGDGKNPLSLLYKIKSVINEGMGRVEKRKVNISTCPFKVCNYG